MTHNGQINSQTSISSLTRTVREMLDEMSSIEEMPDGIRVTTHCMYPSNSLVRVVVHGGIESVIVSDAGGALSEAASAGITTPYSDRLLLSQVASQGLKIDRGQIYAPRVPIDSASVAILLVANASKDVANWIYDSAKVKPDRDFRKLLADFLRNKFDNRLEHNVVIGGASNKAHKFANVIALPDGRRLIVDPVANEPSSINARVVANMDVKAANDASLVQRIIYDDNDDWSPADLNLLTVGATTISFSRSAEIIDRIAASA